MKMKPRTKKRSDGHALDLLEQIMYELFPLKEG